MRAIDGKVTDLQKALTELGKPGREDYLAMVEERSIPERFEQLLPNIKGAKDWLPNVATTQDLYRTILDSTQVFFFHSMVDSRTSEVPI